MWREQKVAELKVAGINCIVSPIELIGDGCGDSFYPQKSPCPSFFSSKKSLPLFFTRQESHCFFLLFIVVFLFFAKRSPYPSFLFFRKVFGEKAFAPSYSFGEKSLAQSFFPAKKVLAPSLSQPSPAPIILRLP